MHRCVLDLRCAGLCRGFMCNLLDAIVAGCCINCTVILDVVLCAIYCAQFLHATRCNNCRHFPTIYCRALHAKISWRRNHGINTNRGASNWTRTLVNTKLTGGMWLGSRKGPWEVYSFKYIDSIDWRTARKSVVKLAVLRQRTRRHSTRERRPFTGRFVTQARIDWGCIRTDRLQQQRDVGWVHFWHRLWEKKTTQSAFFCSRHFAQASRPRGCEVLRSACLHVCVFAVKTFSVHVLQLSCGHCSTLFVTYFRFCEVIFAHNGQIYATRHSHQVQLAPEPKSGMYDCLVGYFWWKLNLKDDEPLAFRWISNRKYQHKSCVLWTNTASNDHKAPNLSLNR